ncbi:class I SAM-dependent methyltransferase [Croceicoccus ponticola]|uniref:Class I SAM-dependent methyltransferase n=1 Tax=Croceicoccus ponticola TaxID=2217664 RepID=A0A437H1E6_9SPHN|nr:cyclopropane-fatty-acyl-phospholipid synthase family protein [Croceicoccus ponticola]RVQ69455.1 class I SAM-dependent methyltransferase [Croceicoccus ponticola]
MAQSEARGRHLIDAGLRFQHGSGWLARTVSGGVDRIVAAIDAGLRTGTVVARLPDGSTMALGGRAPGFHARIHIKDWRALIRLATGGSVGWYRAWEAGEWDSPDPVPIFALFMANADALGELGRAKGPWRWVSRLAHAANRNTLRGARANIAAHYDLGNDFYAAWLDPTLSYSSGLFTRAGLSLEQAQREKVRALADRLNLSKGDEVLEIGCGWGFLARTLANDHAADVTAISLSDEQLDHARAANARDARPVDFRKQDYRDTDGRYDAIVSVEMAEALGREYWPTYMDCMARCLKPGGRAAIQYISMRDDLFDAYAKSADFIQTFIFPGGLLIRTSEFRRLAEERGLEWRDQRDFGIDYAETLKLWRERFDRAAAEGKLPRGFDARFIGLWRFYLMYCEGGFRGGGIDVHQVTLVKPAQSLPA